MSDVKIPTHFKDWAIPGPIPPGAHTVPELSEDTTLDALCGYFKIFQLKKGHRYSTDDLLVAWYASTVCTSVQQVLELGSGIGTVGNLAAWKFPNAQFVCIEAQEQSVALALQTRAYNGLMERMEIHTGDFREVAVLKQTPPPLFDLVLGSPPYFPLGSGVLADHPQKVACRFEVRGSIDDYCQQAAKHLAPGAVFVCVFPIDPPHQFERATQAAENTGLTITRLRPVTLRSGERPLLGLFVMMRSEDLPPALRKQTWREPELLIRNADGTTSDEYLRVKLSMGFPPT